MAHLDSQKSWGDRAGGVSDPRLVRQVDAMHPAPTTDHEIKAVEKILAMFARDSRDLADLRAMILPDTYAGKYALDLKEAA